MTTYYVDPETGGGSPAGSGTAADPWNGFDNVDWTAFSAGDVLDLGGQTFNGTGTESRPAITADASGSSGNRVVMQNGTIDGTNNTAATAIFCYKGLAFFEFSDLTVKGFGGASAGADTIGIEVGALDGVSSDGRGYKVNSCVFDYTAVGGSSTNRAFQMKIGGTTDITEIVFSNNRFDNTVNKGGTQGIWINLTPQGDAAETKNIRITNNVLINVKGKGIWPYYEDTGDGSDIGDPRTPTNRLQDNLLIADNIITDHPNGSAINFRGSVSGLIKGNYLKEVGYQNSGGNNAINAGADSATVFEDNIIINVYGPATGGDKNAIIVDKFKTNAPWSYDCILRRNWGEGCRAVDNATSAFANFRGIDTQMYCNVVHSSEVGFKRGDTDSGTHATGTWSNNTVNAIGPCWTDFQASSATGDAILRNNIFYTDTNTHCVSRTSGNNGPSSETYNSFDGFSAAEPLWDGAANVAEDVTSIVGDQKFIDRANGDLRLDGDSPCIGTGNKWWSDYLNGYDGLRFATYSSGGVDMGAFPWRPGKNGVAAKSAATEAHTIDAGVDIPKAKAALGSDAANDWRSDGAP